MNQRTPTVAILLGLCTAFLGEISTASAKGPGHGPTTLHSQSFTYGIPFFPANSLAVNVTAGSDVITGDPPSLAPTASGFGFAGANGTVINFGGGNLISGGSTTVTYSSLSTSDGFQDATF